MNKAKDIPEDGGFSYAEQEVLHVEVPPILRGASHVWAKRASVGAFFLETLNTLLSALYVLMTRWIKNG